MKTDICKIIADYENLKGMPDSERVTEYCEDLNFYVFKMEVSRGKINERYSEAIEAKEGKYLADGKRITAVFRITLGHNVTDMQSYPLHDEEVMIQDFLKRKTSEKCLGIKFGEELHLLVRKEENQPLELIALPLDIDKRSLERLDDIRCRWYRRLLEYEREQYKEEIEKIIQAGERTGSRQAKFDYAKEINRRMKTNKKVFIEERMEGYDFRETDLSDAIFITCSLSNSNFSGCNLENAIFINCEMNNCMYYGAMLNNCRTYYGGTVLNINDKSRKIVT